MNKAITIYDAKTNLSKYIKQAKAGKAVYIGSYGEQEVVLMAAMPKTSAIKFGTAAGKLHYDNKYLMGADPDVQKMFYGQDKQA